MMATRTIEDLTIDDVHELFDSVIFLRGEEYYDEGCVSLIEPLDSQTIKGIVQGTQKYDVSISIDAKGEIACGCSCPCDFNCKHAAAALLKWLSIKKRYKNKLQQGKSSSKESLVQLLEKKSKEELIELTKTMIEKHPEFTSLVKIERKEIVSTIKRLFSQYWEWDEVQDLIDQLEAILEGIRRNKQAWNKILFDEMSMCSAMIIKNVENVHDEGDLGIFLDDWFEIYGEIFSTTKSTINEKKEFIRTILKWMEKDDYGYDSSYEKALVGMCTTKEDIALIKTCLEATESRYPKDKEYCQEFYLELYDKIGMDEKYLEVAEQSGLTPVLIDKLIALNRLDEALKICNGNQENRNPQKIREKT
jgi:hemoglobin-like flavoprotein